FVKKSFKHDEDVNDFELYKIYKKIVRNYKIDVILPIGYKSNIFFSKYYNKFKNFVKIPISNYKKISLASDKIKTIKFAEKNGIPVPKSFFVKSPTEIKRYKIKYPVVIKSAKEIMYARNYDELISVLEQKKEFGIQVIQEYIRGPGRGYFALCNKGDIVASFQHQRIRDYPYKGGISSCAKSIYNKELEKLGEKIVKKLNWHGVIMIEFRYDLKDKKHKLLEINPKFWGSLDLAISSGISFPTLASKLAMGYYVDKINKYKVGKKFQWLLPEDTITIKTAKNKIKAIKDYLSDLFNPNVEKDLGYIFIDPIPTIIRLIWTFIKLLW
ncbi:MAG: ATP-grasp domain-containing protein, partial [Candidatus Methanomethylicia archaeon]